MTICQKQLVNPIRSAVHVMQSNDTKQMVDHIMSDFNRYINSNETVALDQNSFEVYFKVLSEVHVKYDKHRRKAVPIRNTVGHRGEGKYICKGGIINIPIGCNNDPNAFKDNCLLASVMFAYLKINNVAKYLKVKKLCYAKSSIGDKNKAVKILKTAIQGLCELCEISYNGPHNTEEILPVISNILKIQIHLVINFEGRKSVIQSFPEKHNYELPRIYLYQNEVNHIKVIDNLKSFFEWNKKIICFDCKKAFGHFLRTSHRCQLQNTCFNCDGIYLSPNTIEIDHELTTYCNSKLSDNYVPEFNCDNCNLTFRTNSCFENHLKKCSANNKGWKCLDCGIFQTAVNAQTAEELKTQHVCGETRKKCLYCFMLKEKDHICKVKFKSPHTVWPNLGFITMKHPQLGNGNCQNCFNEKKNFTIENNITLQDLFKTEIYSTLVCNAHKTVPIQTTPTVITVIVETSRHNFKEYLFCDDRIQTNTDTFPEFYIPYSNTPKPMSSSPCGMKKTAQKVTPQFEKKLNMIYKKPNMTAVDKLMLFLCQSNFKNFTFLVHESNSLFTLLDSFLKLNISPDCVQSGHKLNYLEVTCLQMRFINIAMYLKGSLFEIAEQYNIAYEKYYFPTLWNSPTLFEYDGCKPNLQDFFLYCDTICDRNNKKIFYQNLTTPWCLKSELIKCNRNDTIIFVKSSLAFLRQTIELQEFLITYLKTTSLDIIHPFGWQIFSLSAFTYAVYQYFFLNKYDMFSVMNPYTGGRTNTSRGEYEWTEWLNFKGEGNNIKNSFNSFEGQINFGKFFVDGYSAEDKIVYQFLGCEYHYHNPKECLNPINQERTLQSLNCVHKTLETMKKEDEEVNYYLVVRVARFGV